MDRSKFAFSVDIVAGRDSVDREAVANAIANFLDETYGAAVENIGVKAGEVKNFSHQGYLVWRARVVGETVDKVGDGANPKKVKAPNLESPAEAAAE